MPGDRDFSTNSSGHESKNTHLCMCVCVHLAVRRMIYKCGIGIKRSSAFFPVLNVLPSLTEWKMAVTFRLDSHLTAGSM